VRRDRSPQVGPDRARSTRGEHGTRHRVCRARSGHRFLSLGVRDLPIAVHKGLAVSLGGGLVAVIFLRAAVLLRRASAGPFRSSSTADPLELAQRRKRLDPQRLPVGGLLAAAHGPVRHPADCPVLDSCVRQGPRERSWPQVVLLDRPGDGRSGALLWLVGSGFLADVVGQRQRSPSSLWRRRQTELRTPGGRSGAERSPAAEPGDAFASVDCAALARVLAARLSDALGADFVVSARSTTRSSSNTRSANSSSRRA